MFSNLMQKAVSPGDQVKLFMKSGQEIEGSVQELTDQYIQMTVEGKISYVLYEMIGAWEVFRKRKSDLDIGTQNGDGINEQNIEKNSKLTINSKVREWIGSFGDLNEHQYDMLNQMNKAYIGINKPNFEKVSEEIKSIGDQEILNLWNRTCDMFNYANKINEINPKFGRMREIVNNTKRISAVFPFIRSVKAVNAYFHFLDERYKEAAQQYASIQEYCNAAVVLFTAGKNRHGIKMLRNSIIQDPRIIENKSEEWLYFMSKVYEQKAYADLSSLWTSLEKINEKVSYRQPFLGAVIFFAKYNHNKWLEDLLSKNHDAYSSFVTSIVNMLAEADPETGKADEESEWMAVPSKDRITREEHGENHESSAEKESEEASYEKKVIDNNEKRKIMKKGKIYQYRKKMNFGFIRENTGGTYFFHRSAIQDEILLKKLFRNNEQCNIPVVFSDETGPKGPIAVLVMEDRPIEEWYRIAVKLADAGDYGKALSNMKKVLEVERSYKDAEELTDVWKQAALVQSVPKGTGHYARAKRAQLIEKNYKKAVEHFYKAIQKNENMESSLKDLAALLAQMERTEEAIKVVQQNRRWCKNQPSIENMLISLYQKAGIISELISLLEKKLSSEVDPEKRRIKEIQLAGYYTKNGSYQKAEELYEKHLNKHKDNVPLMKGYIYLLVTKRNYEKAEKMIQEALFLSPDAYFVNMQEMIRKAMHTGKTDELDEVIVNMSLTDLSTSELSGFAKFYCNRNNFQGVEPNRIKTQEDNQFYAGSDLDAKKDITRLEEYAKALGPKRPHDRSAYYLSAARISIDMGDESRSFYRYIGRSFVAKGNAAVLENRPLDTIRYWYSESLKAYDAATAKISDREQDEKNALSRYVYAALGTDRIPVAAKAPPVEEALNAVLKEHPDAEKAFDLICYVTIHSRYAANVILSSLFEDRYTRKLTIEYFEGKNLSLSEGDMKIAQFTNYWNELRRKLFEKLYSINISLNHLLPFEISQAWLRHRIESLEKNDTEILSALDKERWSRMQRILDLCAELVSFSQFEDQERHCALIAGRCDDLMDEIIQSPTVLSVERLHGIIDQIKNESENYLEQLYEKSMPQVQIRLPIETYIPNGGFIEIQIAVENKKTCSPAESLQLIIQQDERDEDLYKLIEPEIKMDGSLKGGEQKIVKTSLQIKEKAIDAKTFSIPLYLQYKTRKGETATTPVQAFSIRLYPEADFSVINNPYAAYTESGIVRDSRMFYGREELITNISQLIIGSDIQDKSVIIYGQKRAGKSSILYHLHKRLKQERNLTVVDAGNIGKLLDLDSKTELLYQILWGILKKTSYAIEDKVEDQGFSEMELELPSDLAFFNHPSPLNAFLDVYEQFERKKRKNNEWSNVRTIVLIDEFSYLFELLNKGLIPDTFMKTWKAILQENFFNVILVGQDVMPSFKSAYSNEFGTTQDERVTYLKKDDAIRLIDEPIRIGGVNGETRYREKAIEKILDLTAGSPFYIQMVCNRLVEFMNYRKANLVTEADIDNLIHQEMVRGANALTIDKFDNLINAGDSSRDAISDDDILKVVTAIAYNSKNGMCARASIVCETRTPIEGVLNDLVKRDILEMTPQHTYRIKVGLFKEWLLANTGGEYIDAL